MSCYLILLPSSFTLFLRRFIFVSKFIRATVPSLHGGVHFKLIYLHLYVWISMPTYALYLKKVDEWLLYFLWYFVWDQSLFSTFTDIWGWLVLCLWIWIMVSEASFLFRVVCNFTGITKTRWLNSSDKHLFWFSKGIPA